MQHDKQGQAPPGGANGRVELVAIGSPECVANETARCGPRRRNGFSGYGSLGYFGCLLGPCRPWRFCQLSEKGRRSCRAPVCGESCLQERSKRIFHAQIPWALQLRIKTNRSPLQMIPQCSMFYELRTIIRFAPRRGYALVKRTIKPILDLEARAALIGKKKRHVGNQSTIAAFGFVGGSPKAGDCVSVVKPKVLIVEDEPIIAMMLEEFLLDAGCEVVATAQTLATGLALANTTELDVAILDMSLGSESSFAVADVLASRGIPFMFASGFGRSSLPEQYRGQIVLNKPFHYPDLVKSLKLALGGSFSLEQSV